MKKLFFLFLFFSLKGFSYTSSDTLQLNTGWNFQMVGKSEIYPAKIPGSIYRDLQRSNLIADPFLSDNEKKLSWVEKNDWIYVDTFFLSRDMLMKSKIDLLFEGVDTHADVYFNDTKIGSTESMFLAYTFPVKEYCKERNVLKIIIHSTPKLDSLAAIKNGIELPGGNRVYSRKAAFQSGWDFAPDLKAGGIWKPVKLLFCDKVVCSSVFVKTISVEKSTADLSLDLEINSDLAKEVEIRITNDSLRINYGGLHELKVGMNKISVLFRVEHPLLWNPNGRGNAVLNKINCEFYFDKKLFLKKEIQFGIRTIELEQKKDSVGKSFTFKINGKPMFMKGANVVPPDFFIGEASDSVWIKIVDHAIAQNMNMLRVWGGGVYPPESFFFECDKKGILVWQDFMFACSMYPGDSTYLNLAKQEAVQAIQRIRVHPSLALWCGNNESIEGWYNWGWKKQFNYTISDSLKLITDYKKLFENILPDAIKENNPTTAYWPSSPSIGWGRKESLHSGDAHYWGVWWGMEPFSKYKEKIPRFMSEYGFQSLPSFASLQEMMAGEPLDLTSPLIKNHQKHPTGFETISNYFEGYYTSSKLIKQYAYLSQLQQRDAMRVAISSHRKNMPYCMGSLYWQLNDCWPAISWSSVDYYSREKATRYEVEKLFSTILATVELSDKKTIQVNVVSDSSVTFNAELQIQLMDFDGNLKWSDKNNLKIYSDSSTMVYNKNLSPYLASVDTGTHFLVVELSSNGKLINQTTQMLCRPKNLKLSRPAISIKRTEVDDEHTMFELKSNVFVKDAEFSMKNDASGFSENYIDMLPNCKYSIIFKNRKGEFSGNGLNIRSLVDIN